MKKFGFAKSAVLFSAVVFSSVFTLRAAVNPIVPEGEFFSDPAPRVGPDGALWLFGSRDVSTNGYCSHANDSYETRDLREWTVHRDILVSKGPEDGVPFLDWELLAPDAIPNPGTTTAASSNTRDGGTSSITVRPTVRGRCARPASSRSNSTPTDSSRKSR